MSVLRGLAAVTVFLLICGVMGLVASFLTLLMFNGFATLIGWTTISFYQAMAITLIAGGLGYATIYTTNKILEALLD